MLDPEMIAALEAGLAARDGQPAPEPPRPFLASRSPVEKIPYQPPPEPETLDEIGARMFDNNY